jgi:hypothetical protein
MTSQGSASGRFTRAIHRRDLFQAEIAMREMGDVSLLLTLDCLELLVEQRPERAPAAAVRWHGRLELEAWVLTLAESQLALAALCAGDRDAGDVLRRLLRRVRPTLTRRIG